MVLDHKSGCTANESWKSLNHFISQCIGHPRRFERFQKRGQHKQFQLVRESSSTSFKAQCPHSSILVSLFFDWSVDMFQTLELVNAAVSRVQQALPATAKITTNRLTFATFPILGYSLTSDRVSQSDLWELATYVLKPPLNRVNGVSTVTVQGGQVPEFHVVPNMAKLKPGRK